MRRFLAVCLALALILPTGSFAANGTIAPFPLHQWFTNAGAPAASYRLFTYTAGTSTKVSVYTTSTVSGGSEVAHSNPITLNSAGRPTSGIYLTPGLSYKFVLAPPGSDDPPSSPVWTQDNIESVPVGSTASNADVTGTAGETLAAGEAVFLSDGTGGNTAGRWYLTDADNTYESSTAQNVGFATEAISSGSSGAIRVAGKITGLTGLTAGTSYYASATAGALTSSAPTNARFLGRADSTTTLVVSQSLPDATSTTAGQVTAGTQTIGGAKTLSGAVTFSSTTLHSGVATFTPLPLGVFQVARQTGDVTKNNNTTFADLTGLAFSVAASGNYYFRCFLKVNSTGTAGVKIQLTGPAAPTGLMFGLQSAALKVDPQAATAFSTTVRTGTGDIEETVTLEGYLRNGANAGTVQVQGAQDTADATDTIFRADSFCIWMQQS